MKIVIKTINESVSTDEPAQILIYVNGELISETKIEIGEQEGSSLKLCPVITSEGIEVKINDEATGTAQILVFARIIAEIEEQTGADGLFYPAITLEEVDND